jgi:hypothetical protein
MAYLFPFHRLVLIGDLYGDKFNTTLSIGNAAHSAMPAVSPALLTSVGGYVEGWFARTTASRGCSIISSAKLTSVKLNRIGTNGLYQDPVTMEYFPSSPVSGGGTARPPAQLSLVATLRGDAERAHAGKGRMFIPPTDPVISMGTDGRITTSQALAHANGVKALIQDVVAAYLAAGVTGSVGITSNIGAGAYQTVTKVSTGRVVDTMRSRRNKILEDPQEVLMST